ncbi:Nn.00g075710.m01.CDS01 [Neocucurbitaria sp. VM-36]
MLESERARHSIEIAPLLTSTDIYREAYDVLIKTNRFIKITSSQGLPLRLLLDGLRVPVVTEEKTAVEKFKGYVLAVHLGLSKPLPRPRSRMSERNRAACHLMILYRDLDKFCEALTDGDAHTPGLSQALQISITVGSVLREMPRQRYTPSLESIFSEKTQETLLASFRNKLRGYKAVAINGHIGDDLAKTVRDEMAQEQWLDSKSVLAEFIKTKEEGTRLFQERRNEEACLRWQDAAVDIDRLHSSSSWAGIVRQGGEFFVSELAELYFLMRLNIAHVQITIMHDPGMAFFAGLMADDSLGCAFKAVEKGFWTSDYMYNPSPKHLAKLQYRRALFFRLQGIADTARLALTHITEALMLQPGDAAILKERKNVVAWIQGMQ